MENRETEESIFAEEDTGYIFNENSGESVA